jgi:CBS domain-containing protein
MAADSGELSVFVRRVHEFLHGPATTCGVAASAADVAALMPGSAAVIVVAPDGAPLGIITDRDLRTKVVAARRDASATLAADVMSAPLVTVEPDAFAFEALLEMTRREIHHLVVLDAGSLVGVVSSDDLLVSQTGHPVTLGKEIARAPSREALGRLAAGVTTLVQRLVDDGGRAGDIARIVAELNDRIVARVLAQAEASLAARGEAPPSTAYCWLVFGSEGRREQTLRTDQTTAWSTPIRHPSRPRRMRATTPRWRARPSTAWWRSAFRRVREARWPRTPVGVSRSRRGASTSANG